MTGSCDRYVPICPLWQRRFGFGLGRGGSQIKGACGDWRGLGVIVVGRQPSIVCPAVPPSLDIGLSYNIRSYEDSDTYIRIAKALIDAQSECFSSAHFWVPTSV